MQVIMQRLRSDMECAPLTRKMSLGETIDMVVKSELQWGSKLISREPIELSTKVFGCIDKTWINGESDETDIILNIIDAYNQSKTAGVIQYLLNKVNLPYDHNMSYSFKDVIDVFIIALTNGPDDSLIELVNKEPKVVKNNLTMSDVQNVKDTLDKLKLDNDDGVKQVLLNKP